MYYAIAVAPSVCAGCQGATKSAILLSVALTIMAERQQSNSHQASLLGRLLEKRITVRLKQHEPLELMEEGLLVQAYGDCCFGVDHFLRVGTKQVHVQEKWESHAPKLRDIRHFIVASGALAAKLPAVEPPLRIYLSRRPVSAPESLFALQASGTESIADFDSIDAAVEALYSRVCAHFSWQPKPLTPELAAAMAGITVDAATLPDAHPKEMEVATALKVLAEQTLPELLEKIYSADLAADAATHLRDSAESANLGAILRFFRTRQHSATEYDCWLAVLAAARPIQLAMELVNSETGRRRYLKSQIGEMAIYPTEDEIAAVKVRLSARGRSIGRKAQVIVIQEGKDAVNQGLGDACGAVVGP